MESKPHQNDDSQTLGIFMEEIIDYEKLILEEKIVFYEREIRYWRFRYIKEHMEKDSNCVKEIFLSTPSLAINENLDDLLSLLRKSQI